MRLGIYILQNRFHPSNETRYRHITKAICLCCFHKSMQWLNKDICKRSLNCENNTTICRSSCDCFYQKFERLLQHWAHDCKCLFMLHILYGNFTPTIYNTWWAIGIGCASFEISQTGSLFSSPPVTLIYVIIMLINYKTKYFYWNEIEIFDYYLPMLPEKQ